jgi:hypothetical protein
MKYLDLSTIGLISSPLFKVLDDREVTKKYSNSKPLNIVPLRPRMTEYISEVIFSVAKNMVILWT